MKSEEESDLYLYDEEFRNTLATVDAEGKRVWIYPKKPSGAMHRKRIGLSIFLLTLFFVTPFIKLNGHPFLLLNIFERKFVLFGQVFWPQDFFLLALTLITFFVFVILFTVAFGRLWCGWACPQTLFMEMVFRKVEYWIEGDANQQRKLNKAPLNGEKIRKKGLKHFFFIAVSILISHTAMAYLIGIDEVEKIVTQSPAEHLAGFMGLVVFTGIFYANFAWFREQACIAVCPYGRLQSVLLVKDSIVVAYDWLRGEPRRKMRKEDTDKRGDCIACNLCVHVCPTGIDIRNGTQLECVNCTACIDACDEVMTKIKKPKGLIRYSSYNAIKSGTQKLFTPRVAGYSVVLILLVSLLTYFISTRADVQVTILKAPGTLYTKTDDGHITNLYQVEIVNKTFEDLSLELKVESPASASLTKVGEEGVVIPKEGMAKRMYIVKIPEDQITEMRTIINLGIYSQGKKLTQAKAKFVGPLKKKS